jgi:hypothetical protein
MPIMPNTNHQQATNDQEEEDCRESADGATGEVAVERLEAEQRGTNEETHP